MIEWQTAGSWNPVVGCSMVSPGCANCYAMKQAWRNYKFGTRGYENVVKATPQGARWTGNVNFVPQALSKPLTRRKPSLWFVNSMSDLFHENVTNEQIAAVMGVIMATAARDQHYVVLTKRIERVPQWLERPEGRGRYLNEAFRKYVPGMADRAVYPTQRHGMVPHPGWPPKNLWIGPSIENQETCKARLPVAGQLSKAGFNVVLSLEPLLEGLGEQFRIQNSEFRTEATWVLLGGESDQGAEARPYDVAWAREIIDTCAMYDVPLFHKQLGSKPIGAKLTNPGQRGANTESWPEDLRVRQAPPSLMPILEAAKRLTKEPT